MTEYEKNVIGKVTEKYKDDEDVMRLVKCYINEVDDEGERDVFYAKKCEEYLNSCGLDFKKFLGYVGQGMHRYLQAEFIKFIFKTIDYLGEPENTGTDGRNEYEVKRLRELRGICKDNGFYL